MISKKIKDLRRQKGLTQKELASKIGIGVSTLGMYEINKRTPDYDVLQKLASYFGVTTDYLIKPSTVCEDKSPYGLRPIPALSEQELAEIADLVDSDPAFAEIREAFQKGSKDVKEFFALGVKMYQMEKKSKNDK